MPAHRHGELPRPAALAPPAYLAHRPIAMPGGCQPGQVKLALPVAPLARQGYVLAEAQMLGDGRQAGRGGHGNHLNFGVRPHLTGELKENVDAARPAGVRA